jgi:hypothetical protein
MIIRSEYQRKIFCFGVLNAKDDFASVIYKQILLKTFESLTRQGFPSFVLIYKHSRVHNCR